MIKDFAALIGSWPPHDGRTSIRSFALDLGLEYQHAATMKQRNSIAPEFWPKLLSAAVKRSVALSHDQLLVMRAAAKRRKGRRARPSQRGIARVSAVAA